jgi:colanic acid/amylovoran biosynthesis glycosyltransferase
MDLTRIDAEVLHIYFGHVAPQFIPLMKVWKHPVVVSYHGADAGVDMDKPGYRAAMQEVLRLATQIQCRSEALAADVIALGCDPDKVVIQRTGIPLEQWVNRERVRPENGAWRLIQSCRFIEKKGLDLTLRAFAEVLKVYPQARLTLVGAGPLRAELEALAEELKVTASVEFTGFLPLGGILKRTYESQIFLHPSRTGADGNREGVPNSMLEAMASGAVAVATDHGGIAEAITDGVSGLLVPENDASALAAAVLRVMGDDSLRLALGRGGRKAVEGKYSQELQSQHLIRLYKDLILKASRRD